MHLLLFVVIFGTATHHKRGLLAGWSGKKGVCLYNVLIETDKDKRKEIFNYCLYPSLETVGFIIDGTDLCDCFPVGIFKNVFVQFVMLLSSIYGVLN